MLADEGCGKCPPKPEKPTHCTSLAFKHTIGLSLSSYTKEREGQVLQGQDSMAGDFETVACTVLHWPVTVARIPDMAYRLESWYS